MVDPFTDIFAESRFHGVKKPAAFLRIGFDGFRLFEKSRRTAAALDAFRQDAPLITLGDTAEKTFKTASYNFV